MEEYKTQISTILDGANNTDFAEYILKIIVDAYEDFKKVSNA